METKPISILIGMPIFENVPVEQFQALLMIQRWAMERTPMIQLTFSTPQRTTLVQARNQIIRDFVEGEYTYLLRLDDDNPPHDPYFSIEKMLDFMKSNKDVHVVSALIKSRDDSHYTIYSSVGEIGYDTPQYIPFLPPLTGNKYKPFIADAVGFGMVLMDRESVEVISKKYNNNPVAQWTMIYVRITPEKEWEDPKVVELADAFFYHGWKTMDSKFSMVDLSENFIFRSRLTLINEKYKPRILPDIQCFHIAKKYVSCDLK